MTSLLVDTVCTICGDELKSTGAESVTFCDACAWEFICDPEQLSMSNLESVLSDDELSAAREIAYSIVAGLTWQCIDCDAYFLLEEGSAQLLAFTEGQSVHCPECDAPGAMPGPVPDCEQCSSTLENGTLVCHVCHDCNADCAR